MLAIIVTTVLFSVVLHGLTAYPAAVRYAARLQRMADEEKASASEHEVVAEMPVRVRHAGGRATDDRRLPPEERRGESTT